MAGFRMKGSERRTTMLSSCGLVMGGAWHGRRYHFLGFQYTPRGVLQVKLRVAGPDDWPFPKDMALTKLDFRQLVTIPGERSPRIETTPLIEEAFRMRPQPTPDGVPSGGIKARAPKEVKLTQVQKDLLEDIRAGGTLKVSRETNRILLVRKNGMASRIPRATVVALVAAAQIRATGSTDEHGNQLYALVEVALG